VLIPSPVLVVLAAVVVLAAMDVGVNVVDVMLIDSKLTRIQYQYPVVTSQMDPSATRGF
jgi:hypothetical protein